MRFLVTRSSDGWYDKKPCERAEWGKYYWVDERNVADPSQVPMQLGLTSWWYAKGINHRVENGHIKRDMELKGWTIEIVSLEDLVDFCRSVGDNLILKTSPFLEIEIYDDYRE